MAELVGSFAASHGPNIARMWGNLKDETREWIEAGFGEMGRRLSQNIQRMIRDEIAQAMLRRD